MVWNILGHSPESEDERKLNRLVGISVTHTFFDWWKLN
jgi:hypothetical protein